MKISNLITIVALLTFHIQASYGKNLTLTEESLCVNYKNNQEKIIYCIESNSNKPEFTTTIAKYCTEIIYNKQVTCYDSDNDTSDEPVKRTTIKPYAQGLQRQASYQENSSDPLPESIHQEILPDREGSDAVEVTRKSSPKSQGDAAGATGRKSATLSGATAIGGNNQFVITVPGNGSGGNKRLNGYKTTSRQDVNHYLPNGFYPSITTWQDMKNIAGWKGVPQDQGAVKFIDSFFLQKFGADATGKLINNYGGTWKDVSPQFNPQDTSIPPASINDYIEFIKSIH